jgi:hypothetical protein
MTIKIVLKWEHYMGRRKKYITEEEKREANNQKVKDFYWRNKRRLDLEASLRYWRKKLAVTDIQIDDKTLKKINTKIEKLQNRLDNLTKKTA